MKEKRFKNNVMDKDQYKKLKNKFVKKQKGGVKKK
jgi:hypothetical protein